MFTPSTRPPKRRGYYDTEDLQVFNRGEKGGIYWFTGGLNPLGIVAAVVYPLALRAFPEPPDLFAPAGASR